MIFQLPAAFLFFELALGVAAAPFGSMHLTKKDVWAPPITQPRAGDNWLVGSKVTVSWYVQNMSFRRFGIGLTWPSPLHLY